MNSRLSIANRKVFADPSDREQSYVNNFLCKLSESDPDNEYFSKSELVEIHSILRKETSTNPWLSKFIQKMVDDYVFLDQSTLKFLKQNKNDHLEQVNDTQIQDLRRKLDEQLVLKKLIEFNKCRIKERLLDDEEEKSEQKSSSDQNELETLNYVQNLVDEINRIHKNLFGSDIANRGVKNSIQQFLHSLQLKLEDYNQKIDNITNQLKNQLLEEVDSILMENLLKMSTTESEKEKNHFEIIESNSKVKRKYLLLNQFFIRMNHLLEKVIKHIEFFIKFSQQRKDFEMIKRKIEGKVQEMTKNSKMFLDQKLDGNDEKLTYEQMIIKLKEMQPKMNYEKIFATQRKLNEEIIMLQHELDSN